KPGASNKVADALSRVPADWPESESIPSFHALVSSHTHHIVLQLQQDNVSDPFYKVFHDQHAQGVLPHPYAVVNGILLHASRFVINPASALCHKVISEFHDTPSGGHA
ncbi:Ty3/gypsy retrotransposon protein, partial [Trifolium medium]|nr:Ty3/gypsy retrotransposon protein [Trifolium medium]